METGASVSAREVLRLIIQIDNSCTQPSAPRAVSQAVNGCAAHDWGQVLTFQGKIGQGKRLIYQKVLANFALLLVFAILAPPIVLGLSHTAIDSIPLIITSLISFLVVRGESCSVSTFVSRFGELRARIKQELANQRNWG